MGGVRGTDASFRTEGQNQVKIKSKNPNVAPVAVGGVGGSGTRLVQNILERLGFFMGSDLNIASDNLWFTFLFVRPDLLTEHRTNFEKRAAIFRKAMLATGAFAQEESSLLDQLENIPVHHGPMMQLSWLRDRADSLRRAVVETRPTHTGRWGWKEPNTHIALDNLIQVMPKMQYIHVIRNGLDMAFADKQHQPFLWGNALFGMPKKVVDPRYSLEYWCRANRRAIQIGDEMGDRFFLLNYDDLCVSPEITLAKLFGFLDVNVESGTFNSLVALVQPPDSIGRFRGHNRDEFDPQDIEFVASLGFDTNWA